MLYTFVKSLALSKYLRLLLLAPDLQNTYTGLDLSNWFTSVTKLLFVTSMFKAFSMLPFATSSGVLTSIRMISSFCVIAS